MIKNPFRFFWVILGFLSLGLAVLGVFMPFLPTVPFLLLTLYCFARGSEKLRKWFVETKIYKNNLESYKNKKELTLRTKIKIITSITIVMGVGFIMMSGILIGRIALAVVWLIHVIYFMFGVRTIHEIDVNEEVKNL